MLRVSANGGQTYEDLYGVDGGGAVIAKPIDFGAASDQLYLLLYGTGLRGAAAGEVKVTIGGRDAPVVGVAAQGTYQGVDQVNVSVRRALAGGGQVQVLITAGGIAGPIRTVGFR